MPGVGGQRPAEGPAPGSRGGGRRGVWPGATLRAHAQAPASQRAHGAGLLAPSSRREPPRLRETGRRPPQPRGTAGVQTCARRRPRQAPRRPGGHRVPTTRSAPGRLAGGRRDRATGRSEPEKEKQRPGPGQGSSATWARRQAPHAGTRGAPRDGDPAPSPEETRRPEGRVHACEVSVLGSPDVCRDSARGLDPRRRVQRSGLVAPRPPGRTSALRRGHRAPPREPTRTGPSDLLSEAHPPPRTWGSGPVSSRAGHVVTKVPPVTYLRRTLAVSSAAEDASVRKQNRPSGNAHGTRAHALHANERGMEPGHLAADECGPGSQTRLAPTSPATEPPRAGTETKLTQGGRLPRRDAPLVPGLTERAGPADGQRGTRSSRHDAARPPPPATPKPHSGHSGSRRPGDLPAVRHGARSAPPWTASPGAHCQR